MSPQHKESLARWLPLLTTVIAILSAWVTLSGRVSALEARADDRHDDISQIRQDVAEVRRQVGEIYRVLLGQRNPR